jgi:hypothetical protein
LRPRRRGRTGRLKADSKSGVAEWREERGDYLQRFGFNSARGYGRVVASGEQRGADSKTPPLGKPGGGV